jgi:hypothetical protein
MSTPLRVLSVDARGFGRDHAGLARVISAAEPDVVCVHGGPHLLRWRSIGAALARRAGLVVVTGGRTAGANLLLSTLGVDVTAVRDVRFTGGSRFAAPGAALAALRLRGTDFVLASATLAGNPTEQLAQTRELRAAITTLVPGDLPVIISGEGADRTGAPSRQSLVENRVVVADRLFVDARITLTDATEQDHLVRAELSI